MKRRNVQRTTDLVEVVEDVVDEVVVVGTDVVGKERNGESVVDRGNMRTKNLRMVPIQRQRTNTSNLKMGIQRQRRKLRWKTKNQLPLWKPDYCCVVSFSCDSVRDIMSVDVTFFIFY